MPDFNFYDLMGGRQNQPAPPTSDWSQYVARMGGGGSNDPTSGWNQASGDSYMQAMKYIQDMMNTNWGLSQEQMGQQSQAFQRRMQPQWSNQTRGLDDALAARGLWNSGIALRGQNQLAGEQSNQLGDYNSQLARDWMLAQQQGKQATSDAWLKLFGGAGEQAQGYYGNWAQMQAAKERNKDQGGGWGGLFGGMAGSFLGPVGSAAGGWAGNKLFG